jgi:hypothetical protein
MGVDPFGNLIMPGSTQYDNAGNMYNPDGSITLPTFFTLPWWVYAGAALALYAIIKR